MMNIQVIENQIKQLSAQLQNLARENQILRGNKQRQFSFMHTPTPNATRSAQAYGFMAPYIPPHAANRRMTPDAAVGYYRLQKFGFMGYGSVMTKEPPHESTFKKGGFQSRPTLVQREID